MLSRAPAATTRVAGVIGDPVRHSLSPRLHNAAFAAAGLDWVYVAFPVRAGGGAAAVAAVRHLGLGGLSVTMPHKAAAAGAVDRLTPVAARLGAANTVVPDGEHLIGDSTDGAGLIASLRADLGWDPAGRSCAVLGAGGAARSAALALAGAGAGSVAVAARRAVAASECAELAGGSGSVAGVEAVAAADLVVDATSVGMSAPGTLPLGLDPGWLHAGQVVVDLVYDPPETALLAAARRAGATATNGLGMLVQQAALQFQAWTGLVAPVAAMVAAAAAG